MSCDIGTLREILKDSSVEAVKNLLLDNPAPFAKGDLEKIESEILSATHDDANLVEILGSVRKIAIDAGTPTNFLRQWPIAVEYPLPKNPYSDGFQKAEQICADARNWLESSLSFSVGIGAPTPGPALAFVQFLVAAILEFRVLHIDYVPAILRSLHEKRQFNVHTDTIWAIPLSLSYGRQDNAEGRLLILRQNSVKLFSTFVNKPESCSFPAIQVESAANFGLRTSEFLKALISDAMRDPVLIGHPAGVLSGSLPELIAAARTVAVLELPSVVVAHRGRQIVSHSLPPEALGRIGGWNLKPLPKPSLTSKPPDDPTVKIPEGSSDEPEWMSTLRRALDGNALDYPLLNKLASGEIVTASLLAQFALSIAKPRNGERVGHGSGKCAPASVRRYCLLIATKVIPRLGSMPATDPTADAWEDVIEQILDEDEFYFRKRYTANPSSNAETHSRPLVKAIRHWLHFLDHHFAPKSRGEGDLNDEGNLLSIERKLPVLGLVKVDASFITVDEYQRALRSLVRSPGSTDEREARRIALILGYRCGLRKAEAAGLRVLDFDRCDFLHVVATQMRPLKTSNARRDLPLALLIPEEELEYIHMRLWKIRALARKLRIPQEKAYLFSQPDDPRKLMDFGYVLKDINRVFREGNLPDRKPIDAHFHYHRLRHSFGNLMLLKLWPDLQRIAKLFLSGRQNGSTRLWIAGSRDFREKLFGTGKVTESDLQAIALLMGHGSAATSLEHYLHVLDWYECPESWSDEWQNPD